MKLERVSGRSTEMRCQKCKFIVTNSDVNMVLGVNEVKAQDAYGDIVTSYENTGENWKYFFSWYCLKKFRTYEERNDHDKKYHKVGDFMVGCVPSGFPVDYKAGCGDENIV